MSSSSTVVLLASDLMLSSTVSGFAASAGAAFRSVSSIPEAVEVASEQAGVLLFVDLGTPGLDVGLLASSVPESVLATAVAYGPHVHTAKLQAAIAAGFGQVLSRGQFSASVGRIIANATSQG